MSDFIADFTALPGPKAQWDGLATEGDEPDMFVSSTDYNLIRQACIDLRGYTGSQAINAKARDVVGDPGIDDGPALEALFNDNPGTPIALPRGQYRVDNTITLSNTSNYILGAFGNRFANGGTEILYMGTGPCIQIGTDNGTNWDGVGATELQKYDGPQDHLFMNLRIRHGASDTALASAPGAGNQYKAGAYGLWDWRGGGIVMRNMGFEHFEANFAGIQSDINIFDYVISLYSKYGLYIGPRSDQQIIQNIYSYFCDRAVTIDRAGQTRILGGQMVFCGTATSSHIEIRKGSHGTLVSGAWFENSGAGFQGNMQSFVSAGEVNGYGAGGSIQSPGGAPTTTAVAGCAIRDPHCYQLPAGVAHTKYLASVGFCNQFVLEKPTEYINSGLSSFDALTGIQAANAPITTDTQIHVQDPPMGMSRAKMFLNLGGGPVVATTNSFNTFDAVVLGLDTTVTHTIRGVISHAAPANVNGFTTTNGNVGQTIGNTIWRLLLNGSYDTTAGPLFPVGALIQALATRSAGANSVGQTALSLDASGSQSNTALATSRGDVRLNQSSGILELASAVYLSNEIAPASLGADQTDWNPTGLASASIVIVTSSIAVAINSMVIDNNSAGGRDLVIWNGNASGGPNVTLKDQAAALGTAARRFIGRAYADVVLAPGTQARLRYSTAKSRIIIL